MPTCEQVNNARLLAQTLEKIATEFPEHFHMSFYAAGKMEPVTDDAVLDGGEVGPTIVPALAIDRHHQGEHPHKCGTSGCALGWAPFATGIPLKNGEDWDDYAYRVLGIHPHTRDYGRLFLDFRPPQHGAAGAARAAERVWAWVEENEGDCRETT